MPGPSSSQEIELDFITWHTPDSPPVCLPLRVAEGMHREVNDAFAAAPHGGAGTGGILLGRREAERVVIEDFEPAPCEHRLSDADRAMLGETLEWSRAQPGLAVLGFYRSHTFGEPALCPEDADLLRSHFAAGENLVVLIKPNLTGLATDDFCMRRYNPGEAPAADRASGWPAPRRRLGTEDRPPRKTRIWYAAAAVLALAGGGLGYAWLHARSGAGHPAASAAAATTPVARPAASAVETAVDRTPAPPAPDLAGVRALLDRWAEALKRGDAGAAAQCYAPVVTTYFSRHGVTREAVRRSLLQARASYGRLEVYRVSGLGITPVSDSRAVATFRKRWRYAGRTRARGEEAERMTLVRNQGAWQISSEQPEPR